MPNPNPVQSDEFLRKRFNAPDMPPGESLAAKVHGVRLPQNVNAAVEQLGKNKTPWLRQAICSEALRQGLVDSVFDKDEQKTRTYVVYLSLDWCPVHTEVEAPENASDDELHELAITELAKQLYNSKLKEIANS